MIKIIASASLMLLIGFCSMAQQSKNLNVYLDALKLLDAYTTRTGNGRSQNAYFLGIISKYGLNQSTIKDNPFLNDYVPGIVLANDGSLQDKFTITPKEKVSTEPLNFQAAIINGTANFMAGRFKEEVLSTSINYLFKAITENANEAKLTKAVFPKTFELIEGLYKKQSYYTADLIYVRQVAQFDLNQLPDNLIQYSDDLLPKLITKPEYKDILVASQAIYQGVKKGRSVEKIITSLAELNYSQDNKVKNVTALLDLMSQALINQRTASSVWVNFNNLPPLEGGRLDDLNSRFFYGLLFEQLKKLPFMRPFLMENGEYIKDVKTLSDRMHELTFIADKLNQAADFIKAKNMQISSASDAVAYMRTLGEIFASFNENISIFKNVKLQITVPQEALTFVTKYIDLVDAVQEKDYQRIITTLLIEFGSYTSSDNFYNKHLTFIAQMADLKSAQDMEALLNAYALPIGGSSIKRQSSFNLSINGYVGITAGTEKAYGSLSNQSKANIGLTAPIGVSSTFLSGKLTAFISLIDLGSVVNQRLNNDTTSYTDFKIEYFFTPGVGLYYNAPKLPVTFGVHWNYIPNLRTIKYQSGAATITETNRSVSRFNFSILVDLPFFTLFNKSKQ